MAVFPNSDLVAPEEEAGAALVSEKPSDVAWGSIDKLKFDLTDLYFSVFFSYYYFFLLLLLSDVQNSL